MLVIQDQQTLLFIGDSITDSGRRDTHPPLGYGYVRLFADMQLVREPHKRIHMMNRGIGGNTVDDLRSRWCDDVINHRPDWLVMAIGINDISWHLSDPKYQFLSPEGFGEIYETLLSTTVQHLQGNHILLVTPYFMSKDTLPGSFRRKMLDAFPAYIQVIKQLAERYETRLLDLHEVFQSRLQIHPPDVYGLEPVHPNSTGSLLIAEQIYQSFSMDAS
jgi:lysophospholipase L1-like esterase